MTELFGKLMKVCSKNHFFNLKNVGSLGNVSCLEFGPLGSLFKRNIFKEWLSSILNNNEIPVFPLEVQNLANKPELSQRNPEEMAVFLSEVIKNYNEMTSALELPLPFGFAVYGPCANNNLKKDSSTMTTNILSDFKSWTGLSVFLFCPPKKSKDWFYYWSKQRYLWWRKFSSIPSKFSMSDVTTISDNQRLSLILEFPWGKHPLETITLYSSSSISEICKESVKTPEQPEEAPCIVACETELDLAVLAYLGNSFAEKFRGGEIKNILHLHYKLAPYKICLSIEETDVEHFKKLKAVAAHLLKELKKASIAVFPFSDVDISVVPNKFDWFDETGVLYTIVLSESSLHTGIAGLRNRDTTLQEQIHITELIPKLSNYLKTRS